MSIDAMKQALEALQHCLHYAQTHLQHFDAAYNRHPSAENERGVITDDIEDAFAALTALRAAIEQAHGDWDELEALRESLREHMAEIHRLQSALEQGPVAWVYPEGLEALKSGRPWTAYGSSGEGRIPLYLNDAVAPRVEPRSGESGAGFESLPASPHKLTEQNA